MRKVIISIAAAAGLAMGAFSASGAQAAPIASQTATVVGADHLLPTGQIRWRRHYVYTRHVV